MFKTKYKKNIALLVLSLLTLTGVALTPGNAQAASLGCYLRSGSSYEATPCPQGVVPSGTTCYVAGVSSSAVGNFNPVDCNSFLEGGRDTTTAGERSEVDSDCTNGIDPGNCGITRYLRDFINVLSGIVGVVVVIMITAGGVQYSTARDNPQAAAAAKQRIYNAVLALVAFLFVYAFLQWLVPGGVL